MRRIKDFSILGMMTERPTLKAAWGALDGFNRTVRSLQRELGLEHAKIASNKDLTIEARERRLAGVTAKLRAGVEASLDVFTKAKTAAVEEIDGTIEKLLDRDPLPAPPVDFAGLGESDKVLARLSLANHEQSARVARLLVEQKVDKLLDRALAADKDSSGGTLLKLHAQLGDDPLALSVLESGGVARVRAEGSLAQRTAFEFAVSGAREARLPDAGRLLLDHRDALEETEQLLPAIVGDTKGDRFLSDGYAPALGVAPQVFGDELAGLGE